MRYLSIAALLLAVGPLALAAQDIDNTSAWDGSSVIGPFGKTNTATYGQTFTVGSETYLNSFEFWLRHNSGGTDLLFSAYVAEWDGTKAGSILWNSDESSPYSGPTTGAFQNYFINTGGVGLSSGQTYVAFFSASKHFADIASASATTAWGYTSTDAYSGGRFVFMNNGSDFSQLTTTAWSHGSRDAAFRADFSPTGSSMVPEPAGLLLLATGLFGIGGVAWRRRES